MRSLRPKKKKSATQRHLHAQCKLNRVIERRRSAQVPGNTKSSARCAKTVREITRALETRRSRRKHPRAPATPSCASLTAARSRSALQNQDVASHALGETLCPPDMRSLQGKRRPRGPSSELRSLGQSLGKPPERLQALSFDSNDHRTGRSPPQQAAR